MKFLTNFQLYSPDPTATGYDGGYSFEIVPMDDIGLLVGTLICPFKYNGVIYGTELSGERAINKIELYIMISNEGSGSVMNKILGYAYVGASQNRIQFYDSSDNTTMARIGSILSTTGFSITPLDNISGYGLSYTYDIENAIKAPSVWTLVQQIPQGYMFYGRFKYKDEIECAIISSSEVKTRYIKDANLNSYTIAVNDDISVASKISSYDVITNCDVYVTEGFYNSCVQPAHFILYNNKAETQRIDKTEYLEMVRYFSGVFRAEQSVTSLSIEIEGSIPIDFNYVYLLDLKRYYFVMDWEIINANLIRVYLAIDVLMSYKDAILGLNAYIDRNEFEYNKRLLDHKDVVENGYELDVIENRIPEILTDGETFVLTGYRLFIKEEDSSD